MIDRKMIDTRIVYGFLDAGKTSCIQDCILNDFFYKRGSTLILCFEQGEAEYDIEALQEKRTQVAYYENKEDVTEFCERWIEQAKPDRIYVEMNSMIPNLREKLPQSMNVTYVTTWVDWSTLEVYFANFKQMVNQMVSESHQVTFRGCPSKELLAPYSQAFRLMNHNASYLRQDPMGYHEKAFDLFVPYSLDEKEIEITVKEYLPFWLDAAEHPEHYDGKTLYFSDPLELRHISDESTWSAGRVVMTCCMSDLQFMSFELGVDDSDKIDGGWVTFEAGAEVGTGKYGRKVLKLRVRKIQPAQPPEKLII